MKKAMTTNNSILPHVHVFLKKVNKMHFNIQYAFIMILLTQGQGGSFLKKLNNRKRMGWMDDLGFMVLAAS